jgi:hypothetical protein
MKNINWKLAIWIVLSIAFAVFLISCFIIHKNILQSLSSSVTITTFIIGLFCECLWKCKVFKKWLVLVPDLNGNWEGFIRSDWVEPKINPIKTSLSIKQSLFHISCVMSTKEMKSNSGIIAGFKIDTENQTLKLSYIYHSKPNANVREKSPMHYGAVIFDIEDDNTKLSGNYWTDRKTTGTIELHRERSK